MAGAVQLTDAQAAAVKAIVDWYGRAEPQEFYLAGYAGTGKSTLVDVALGELRERHGIDDVRVGTYTGKAAQVLRNKGVDGAQTIHSMIYTLVEERHTGEMVFELNAEGPAAQADLIVLDECSMVPEQMADDLRSFGKKILVMGDPGQLPPVNGQGGFTAREPDMMLTEIHRQAADSPIIRLATMARQGQRIPLGDYGDGVRVVPYNRDAGPYVYDGEAQVICGLNRVRWGLTQRIRQQLGHEGRLPQPGEPILCVRNNPKNGLLNGLLGALISLEPPKWKGLREQGFHRLEARLEGFDEAVETLVHRYLFEAHFTGVVVRPEIPKRVRIDHFDWGYVLTCHKAQGSQWPRVTVVDDSAAFRDDRHRWLYTAITRAESGLTLIAKDGGCR